MVVVLGDEDLYAFIGGHAPSEADLVAQYSRWQCRRSPDGTAEWLNWIVRLRDDRAAIGTVQATVVDGGRRADVAWVIGRPWQSRGYASEAALAMIDWLEARGAALITAHIHPAHVASQAVARRAGLAPTGTIEHGEVLWERRTA
jgi:RimJ/RimL family protein N-acetyltransferase